MQSAIFLKKSVLVITGFLAIYLMLYQTFAHTFLDNIRVTYNLAVVTEFLQSVFLKLKFYIHF